MVWRWTRAQGWPNAESFLQYEITHSMSLCDYLFSDYLHYWNVRSLRSSIYKILHIIPGSANDPWSPFIHWMDINQAVTACQVLHSALAHKSEQVRPSYCPKDIPFIPILLESFAYECISICEMMSCLRISIWTQQGLAHAGGWEGGGNWTIVVVFNWFSRLIKSWHFK